MDSSVSKKLSALALGGLLALTFGAGTMRASNTLLAAPVVSGGISCHTLTGVGAAQTITVKPTTALTGSGAITVTFTGAALAAGLVVTPSSTVLNATTNKSFAFTVNAAPGCNNLTAGSLTVQFQTQQTLPTVVALANDATATVVSTYTSNGNPLAATSSITVTCGKTGATYLPSSTPATISLSSAAVGGTPYTFSGVPAWLSLSATTGTAGATATILTANAASPCGNLSAGGSTFTSLTVTLPQALTTTIGVTIKVVAGSPLTASPTSISLSHIKGSGATQTENTSVTSSGVGTYFTVNTATLPIWLTVNATFGTAPASLTFSTTSVADTMPPGSYSATVYLQVYGSGDLPIPISLFVTNQAPKFSISSANPALITWVQGSAAPTATITAMSTDSPIPYTITTGGTLAPIVSATEQSGLAYSFGTNIGITFNPQIYQTVSPGTVISGTVSFTYGNPASVTVVTINLTVAAPGATISGLSPGTLPTAVAGSSFPVVVSGAGFVASANPAQSTKVGIVVGGVLIADSNFSVNVVNPSSIILTITVPTSADALLPFAPGGVGGVVGGSVNIGVCNGTCLGTAPTGTSILTIGGGPVIQGVTSSSSFTEVTAPTPPSVAPYDMISIFGVNFCSSVGTGCSTSTLLSASPDSLTLRYPLFLSPDTLPTPPAVDTRRRLTVTFYPHGTLTGGLSAPLLFATNGQINAIVPGLAAVSSEYDIVVSFSCALCTPATTLNSAAFPVNIVAADPGIFTIGSDGQGGAAALESSNYALISSTNPAAMRSGGVIGTPFTNWHSDTILLYMTGLGLPTSTGTDLSVSQGCIGPVATSGVGSYEAVLQAFTNVTPALANIDGAVIQSKLLLTGNLPPCLTAEPTVYIGGAQVPAAYAGFTPDSVGGLYQINVQLPPSGTTFYPNYPAMTNPIAGLTAPVQLPVTVSVGGVFAQSGVTMWVSPQLSVAAPSITTMLQLEPYTTGNAVVATLGTGPYTYALTSGVLPAGLMLNQSGGSTGLITGTPAANTAGTYLVTVTATDSSSPALTGSVSFAIVVNGGLYVTSSAPGPFTSTFGNAGAGLPTISAIGGDGTYNWAVTTSSLQSAPTGMSAPVGVFAVTGATKAGTYQVTVTASDTSTPSPVTGSASFTDTIALSVIPAATTNTTITTGGGIQPVTTIPVLGNTGPVTCTVSDTVHFSCSVSTNTVTLSTLNPTAMTATTAYPVTVTVTDTATASGAQTGTFATGTTVTITATPAT
jgi:uncharacterized protein (TIGR03437 family)